jgi:hypothetical protein
MFFVQVSSSVLLEVITCHYSNITGKQKRRIIVWYRNGNKRDIGVSVRVTGVETRMMLWPQQSDN